MIKNYTFRSTALLEQALCHSSFANEVKGQQSYERLEFLGDSLLSVIISEHLFLYYPHLAEGDLSKTRAAIVCEQSLGAKAKELNLGRYIRFSRGEENTGGRERISILADVVEAVIAAIYLDSDFETAKAWVLDLLADTITLAVEGKLQRDYKTALQELVQSKGPKELEYVLVAEHGPDHNKNFVFAVYCDGKKLGEGCGKTKKEAEQEAAKAAIAAG